MKADSKQQRNTSTPDVRHDPQNARNHPERNKAMIRESLQQVGAFRSIAIDGDGIVRAGNGVWEAAQELGLTLRVVDAGPDEIIGVRRSDLTGDKAVLAAIYDNRTGETSYWDLDTLEEIDASGILETTSLWTPEEWTALLDPDSMSEEPAGYVLPEADEDEQRGPPPAKISGRGTVDLSERPDHEEKYPVPIVLSRQEYETWITFKAELSQREGRVIRDKDAFWELVTQATGTSVDEQVDEQEQEQG